MRSPLGRRMLGCNEPATPAVSALNQRWKCRQRQDYASLVEGPVKRSPLSPCRDDSHAPKRPPASVHPCFRRPETKASLFFAGQAVEHGKNSLQSGSTGSCPCPSRTRGSRPPSSIRYSTFRISAVSIVMTPRSPCKSKNL